MYDVWLLIEKSYMLFRRLTERHCLWFSGINTRILFDLLKIMKISYMKKGKSYEDHNKIWPMICMVPL